MTDQQLTTLKRKYEQNPNGFTLGGFIDSAQPTVGCDGAVAVFWSGMWLCIEEDGYCHT